MFTKVMVLIKDDLMREEFLNWQKELRLAMLDSWIGIEAFYCSRMVVLTVKAMERVWKTIFLARIVEPWTIFAE